MCRVSRYCRYIWKQKGVHFWRLDNEVLHLQQNVFISEAQKELLHLITSTKETIADPDKHMGRFTKDDRVGVL